ncbi:hypothetical protein [Pontibacillus litoralis]|uniref:Uncharacterized protein n=1 Tax=Pontibacillus litoralis JSM 072002 TaxID=1385512 RepID=A0A0A5GB04_9BACI|nr:hypothetical protein [Pontibacillus litoralis]KGX89214.1 hypothetical protein N784_02050 [Pontibacillus litoralis JSM 072002]
MQKMIVGSLAAVTVSIWFIMIFFVLSPELSKNVANHQDKASIQLDGKTDAPVAFFSLDEDKTGHSTHTLEKKPSQSITVQWVAENSEDGIMSIDEVLTSFQ